MLVWCKQKPHFERAMDWFKANLVPGQGFIMHRMQPVPYQEDTGSFMPTLFNWGETALAKHAVCYLEQILFKSGGVNESSGKVAKYFAGAESNGVMNCFLTPYLLKMRAVAKHA